MGQLLPFTSAAAHAPAPVKHMTMTPAEIAWSIREKIEWVVQVFEEHEIGPVAPFCGSCGCPTCETYRLIWLQPSVQRILLELFR
jgi:hypothetical protein